jgi:tetratricopeptide (TPR) repeat protein
LPTPQQKLHGIVAQALVNNDIKLAINACRQLNSQFPDYLEGWQIAGQIHRRLNKPEAALIAADRALALAPQNPDVLLQKVDCLLALDNIGAAQDILLGFARLPIDKADTHDHVGRLLASLELHEQAMVHYQQALALTGDNPSLWYNLATAQRFLGQLTDAEHSLDRALALNPLDFEAQAMRSSLRKQTGEDNHVAELKRVLEDPALVRGGSVNICYALAKELDELDQPAQSFHYLKQGADTRRAQMSYRVENDLDTIAAIQRAFDAGLFSSSTHGSDSVEPIFILGMPRTGTTLVERILGSHSEVHAAGELDNFGREMMRLLGQKEDKQELAAASATLDPQALGDAYVASTRPMTGHTPRFIDKLPFNFLYAGLIHRALPQAKIIHLTRHPMATCYAIYKQLFRDAYPFSYSLEDLGRYYVAYHQLMAHWREVMPGVIYDLPYEQVVADTEGEARKLLEHCDLQWQAQCLRFYENQQASTTASAAQVRRPIYSSSLERWRSYRDELAPLAAILNTAGIATD